MNPFLKNSIKAYSNESRIRSKCFYDAICFILLVLKICNLIFDDSTIAELLHRLNNYSNLKGKEEQKLIDILVANFSDKIARKIIVYDDKKKPKMIFETIDFQKTRLFHNCFIGKNSEFYIYKNLFESNELNN